MHENTSLNVTVNQPATDSKVVRAASQHWGRGGGATQQGRVRADAVSGAASRLWYTAPCQAGRP